MVRVKICGITNWADAKRAADAGAEMLGFNFCARSPRYISESNAARIIGRLPKRVRAVGVFVNESPQRVLATARRLRLAAVQLHGDETPASARKIAAGVAVIKAFRVRRGFRVSRLGRYTTVSAYLLDGFSPKLRGGAGRTFNWGVARAARRFGRVILAGGLDAQNVGRAMAEARPYAVDVCSGIESRPGKKDARKMSALFRAVEQSSHKRRNPAKR